MCQAIPSILSCLWPAFHLKDTTKVNALWLSSPPTTSPCFCNTSESDDLKSDWRHEKTNTSTTFPCQSCSTGPARYVCCCQRVVGLFCTADKDEKKKKKKKSRWPTPNTYCSDSCRCASSTKLWCHVKLHTFRRWARDYYHSAKWK